MSRPIASLLALILVSSPSIARADSYWPFRNFRVVDPTGRYYIVVKKNGGESNPGRGTPVTFEIAEWRPESPPVAEVRDQLGGFKRVVVNPEVRVRDGDFLLGSGNLERCPGRILISSTGLGFVGLDVRGYNYGSLRSGDALVVVSKDGTVRQRKDLIDLFNESEMKRFMRTAGGVHWCGGGWIDERRKQVIVVGARGPAVEQVPRLFRIVDMETGKTRDATSEVVLTALSEGNFGAMDEALDLVSELKLDRAKPDLVNLFTNEKTPIEFRLRAAVALASLGDRRGGDLLRKLALENSGAGHFAIIHLPRVIGDEAAIVLCDVVRRHGEKTKFASWQALQLVSSKAAVPPLLDLLREGKPECVDFAVECLGDKGPEAKAAVPDLMRILTLEPGMTRMLSNQEHAAIALGKIGPEARAALPTLMRLAEKQAPDEWKNLRDHQPEIREDHFGGTKYSDNYFVDAICKIRRK
jgi:hypothetical protein